MGRFSLMDSTWTPCGTTATAWMAAAAALMAAMAGPALAATAPAAPHVTAKLIAETAAATPGSVVTLGIDLTIQKKWHVYWNGRNDNGFPLKAEWTLPDGFTVDPFQWPAPVRHVDPGDLLNHVYFDHVTILVPLRVPASAQPGTTVTIKAAASWLVCDESCVGEDADLTLALPISKPGETPAKSPAAKLIDESRARIPKPLPADSKDVAVAWSKEAVTVSVPGAAHLEFYPDDDCVPFARPIKDPVADAAALRITLGDPEPDHTALNGVLAIRRAKDAAAPTIWYRISSKPPRAPGGDGPSKAAAPEPAKPAAPSPVPSKSP